MSEPTTGVFARYVDRISAWIQVGIAGGQLINVDILVEEPQADSAEHPMLDRLTAYLDEGSEDDFSDVSIALTGPTDHRPVYETVRTIPYGTGVDLDEIIARTAALVPEEGAESTVLEAMGKNPVPIVVPDHRVRDAPGPLPPRIREMLRDIEGIA